jgi:hypothetical protein
MLAFSGMALPLNSLDALSGMYMKKPKACVVRARPDKQLKMIYAKTHKEGESSSHLRECEGGLTNNESLAYAAIP